MNETTQYDVVEVKPNINKLNREMNLERNKRVYKFIIELGNFFLYILFIKTPMS